MRPRISICITCDKESPIYAKKMCQYCYWKSRPKKPIVKNTKPIKNFSKKSMENLRRYRKARDEYLRDKPVCEFPNCNSTEVTLHHKKGRLGSYLTDKRYFSALCWRHHQFIETHPKIAKKLNLSLNRL